MVLRQTNHVARRELELRQVRLMYTVGNVNVWATADINASVLAV